jgi:hypothetical protein
MQILTAAEAKRLSAHAKLWKDAQMIWFMGRVMDSIAHEVAAGGNSITFEDIRVGTDVNVEAWISEMTNLGYAVSAFPGEVQGADSFEVRW